MTPGLLSNLNLVVARFQTLSPFTLTPDDLTENLTVQQVDCHLLVMKSQQLEVKPFIRLQESGVFGVGASSIASFRLYHGSHSSYFMDGSQTCRRGARGNTEGDPLK